ncbi:hypothetical protein BV881_02615 [Streptomyces sp. ZL-24]|nr:hypothetical protein BV881_02615 [Streptomyces sp. ZL-24]
MNRLAGVTSPYLLQHAENPVDWWPWSPEASMPPHSCSSPRGVCVRLLSPEALRYGKGKTRRDVSKADGANVAAQ